MTSSKWKLAATLIVALAVVGAVGWQQFTPKPAPPVAFTVTPTGTTLPRTQTTTLPRLHGKLFFDYNGNGKQDPGEPDLPNIAVALNGRNVTATNSTGWYLIADVATGNHTIRPFPPKNFRYMCESAAEFRPVTGFYTVSVKNDTRKDVGLMEGFLTLPFSSRVNLRMSRFYDRDPRNGYVKNWDGKSYPYTNRPGTGADDDHTGTDFDVAAGSVILATAPGTVTQIGSTRESVWIELSHDNGFKTSYNHILRPLVEKGQKVSRGQPIAEVGSTGTFYPHLHFELYIGRGDHVAILDPYRPVFATDASSSGYWGFRGGNAFWVPVSPTENLNSQNYWTKDNDPQYSY